MHPYKWETSGHSQAHAAKPPQEFEPSKDLLGAGRRILLLGSDPILLHSRCDVLERFGYRATFRLIDEAPSLAGFQLIHLCQTIDPARAAALARSIRTLYPGTVVLYTEQVPQPEPEQFDELLPPLLHPVAYVQAVSALLNERA